MSSSILRTCSLLTKYYTHTSPLLLSFFPFLSFFFSPSHNATRKKVLPIHKNEIKSPSTKSHPPSPLSLSLIPVRPYA